MRRLPDRTEDTKRPTIPLGTNVLVIKGDVRNDLGQMAVVSALAGTMVEVSYRGPAGRINVRRKQLGSLVILEDGLKLVTNAEGMRMIVAESDNDTSRGNDDHARVSSDDESGV